MKNNDSNFTQELILPSQGLLNPEIPGGKITQRCMMVSDQKFLSGSNQSPSSALQQLIQRTVVSPDTFDVSKLTLADTLYLLFKLRVLSYGDEYRFRTRCPECGKRIEVNLDLSEIPVELLDEDYADGLVVTLPNRKDTVYTKILTNHDMDILNKEVKRRKRKSDADESEYVLRIVQSIEKIVLTDKTELTNPIQIERYIGELTDLDAAAIMSTRDSVDFGLAPTVEYVCPECKEYIDVDIQFSSDFFRPRFNK